jgi:O-antigen/teichoic acid export membrane protein
LAPLLVLPYSTSLFVITLALVLGRILNCTAYMAICFRLLPELRLGIKIQWSSIRPLMRMGAWMTVTNIAGPLLSYIDRLVIAGALAVSAVSFYATPYDMITKVWIIPGAVVGVLFSEFAKSNSNNENGSRLIFLGGVKYLSLALFPISLFIITYSHEGLRWWIGEEFAKSGAPILQWLTVGVFISSISYVFLGFNEAFGKPDLNAKLQLLEFPVYAAALFWTVQKHGAIGVAVVWTVRITFEFLALLWISTRLLQIRTMVVLGVASGVLAGATVLVIPILFPGLLAAPFLFVGALAIFSLTTWYCVLCAKERLYLIRKFGNLGQSLLSTGTKR